MTETVSGLDSLLHPICSYLTKKFGTDPKLPCRRCTGTWHEEHRCLSCHVPSHWLKGDELHYVLTTDWEGGIKPYVNPHIDNSDVDPNAAKDPDKFVFYHLEPDGSQTKIELDPYDAGRLLVAVHKFCSKNREAMRTAWDAGLMEVLKSD